MVTSRLILLALVVSGCNPTFRFELLPRADDATVVEWRKKVSDRINDHDKKIQDLEKEIQNARPHRPA